MHFEEEIFRDFQRIESVEKVGVFRVLLFLEKKSKNVKKLTII